MLEARDEVPVPGAERAGGMALLRFATALCASSDLAELEHKLVRGFGRLIHAPMYGLYIFDPLSGRPARVAPVNVSETFLARYERLPQGRETDPVHARALESGGAAYNMALMSMQEWVESPVYTSILILHDIRHVVVVPVMSRQTVVARFISRRATQTTPTRRVKSAWRRPWAAWSVSRWRVSGPGRISSKSWSGHEPPSSSPGARSWSATRRRWVAPQRASSAAAGAASGWGGTALRADRAAC